MKLELPFHGDAKWAEEEPGRSDDFLEKEMPSGGFMGQQDFAREEDIPSRENSMTKECGTMAV